MSETPPKTKQEHSPEREVLDTTETGAYLRSRGAVSLTTFTEGKPLIYVFPESIRSDTASLGSLYGKRRPTFARLHAPTALVSVSELAREKGEYGLVNEQGAPVDYYVIDRITKQPELIRTSHSVMNRETPYIVRLEELFEDKPELFDTEKEHT